MKLEEAMEKATPGPYRSVLTAIGSRGERRVIRGYHGTDIADICAKAEPTRSANAALLAHWWNHGPKLLEALKEGSTGSITSTCDWDDLDVIAGSAAHEE
jgi:hypothetical protein